MAPLGRAKFIEMAAANEAWIRNLTAELSPADVKALSVLLQKMKESTRQAL
ncbi:hypothetical protein [Devosia sp. A449]